MHRVQENITVQDLKQGSDLLFKSIYEENRSKFLNFAKKYNLSQDDNIDVYQDAYIIFYNNVMQGKVTEFTSSISTYLFSIGKYLIFDKMKKNNKTINPDFDLSIVREKEALVDPALELEQQELTTEQILLKKYFVTLGKKCQELLTLFYYRGFTIKDIIEAGDYTSENVVKSAKSRCMKTLKERINAQN
ncbi:sigma-70 family RNA polymerase sigma factor [Lacinutrix sp. C3R15]|uniref:RNA polymerase sigma factor n=1 Tax=Flavobacteriaceae TaxID=49546 RepID=UPI001C097AAA|nr:MULTISPECIES: sigma-70 family RNA polymerase sigma factor [Flavobacteriaceae]MBU2939425.1 sigma-70 family RNA polymerase sigma factor [Lacinutrix sp. C3R15]MDO6622740.1 sigma-70 family RNA polymerase sigma factor [Oceanihabitans sp. 1_MG-2023]